MNGTEPKIEIIKPFVDAFELTKRILFQPFDLKKWCVIGFAAFLANLGGGCSFRYNYNDASDFRELPAFQELNAAINQIPHWVLVLGVIIMVGLILTVTVVVMWLRARGRFIFVDCIVKNRGAIAEPWREFRKQGNSYFLFSLLIGFGFLVMGTLLALPFLLPLIRGVTFLHLHDTYLILMIILWGVVAILYIFAWVLIAHMMLAVMYRRRCRAPEAFRIVAALIANYPGEITLYCLFWFVLGLGAVMIGCITTCATCCLTIIPYVGTVILLPVFVCLRAFGLCFLRQFGPDYDVWHGVPPPMIFQAASPDSEPPPLPASDL